MPKNFNVEELRRIYIGKTVHVIINDKYRQIDAWGEVLYIDDKGLFHGTWDSLAAIYGVDYISLND